MIHTWADTTQVGLVMQTISGVGEIVKILKFQSRPPRVSTFKYSVLIFLKNC